MKTDAPALILMLAAALAAPGSALAQEPVRSFDQLNTRLKPGDTVYVTDAQGREVKGKIRGIAPTSLILDRDGTQTLRADAVRQVAIRRGKPVVRTMLIGAGVGAASLAFVAAADCGDCGEAVAGGLMIGALIGAGAGAAIGAMRSGKEVVVYRAPGQARLSVAPVITPRAKGLAVSFAF